MNFILVALSLAFCLHTTTARAQCISGVVAAGLEAFRQLAKEIDIREITAFKSSDDVQGPLSATCRRFADYDEKRALLGEPWSVRGSALPLPIEDRFSQQSIRITDRYVLQIRAKDETAVRAYFEFDFVNGYNKPPTIVTIAAPDHSLGAAFGSGLSGAGPAAMSTQTFIVKNSTLKLFAFIVVRAFAHSGQTTSFVSLASDNPYGFKPQTSMKLEDAMKSVRDTRIAKLLATPTLPKQTYDAIKAHNFK